MVLVDTSVWIEHFRTSNRHLQELLDAGETATHPYVIGELACGRLVKRSRVLTLMKALPSYSPITQEEYLHFVDSYKLAGTGTGFVDIHLMASAVLNGDFLWTFDKNLRTAAAKLGIAHS